MSEQEPSGWRRHPYVPLGVEIAAAWSWRIIIIAIATAGLLWLAATLSTITIPIAVAVLLTALTIGGVDWLESKGVPRVIASFAVLLALVAGVGGLITLVGQQLSTQFEEMRESVVEGISQLQDWAQNGPLGLSAAQIDSYVDRVQRAIASSDQAVISQATEIGTRLTYFVAGIFIALFAIYFFLYEGNRIWRWVVNLFPRAARSKIHSSGVAAWGSMTAFVRATVLVALADAIGIALVAVVLQVPLALAIGVLVFVGAFVPIIGALVSGMVAVLVALVAQGPWTAVLMLIGVVAVQQIESHVLQPFLMGHLVALHPLAIVAVITIGVTTAGVIGALLAVPFAAGLNSVVRHLATGDPPLTDGLVGDHTAESPPDGAH